MSASQAIIEMTAPVPDADSLFYWEGLKKHTLLTQQCLDCRRRRFPPMPACPYCASPKMQTLASTGAGSIYSWIVVHTSFDPAFDATVPYTLVTVDLDDGGRIVGRLEGGVCEDMVGKRVTATFVDHPEWTELRFAPA